MKKIFGGVLSLALALALGAAPQTTTSGHDQAGQSTQKKTAKHSNHSAKHGQKSLHSTGKTAK